MPVTGYRAHAQRYPRQTERGSQHHRNHRPLTRRRTLDVQSVPARSHHSRYDIDCMHGTLRCFASTTKSGAPKCRACFVFAARYTTIV